MPEKKDHQYEVQKPRPNDNTGVEVAACSRCGATRTTMPEPLHPIGFMIVYRMSPERFGFVSELPCTPIEKLFNLARGQRGGEAMSAASRAVSLMAENDLVFYPDTLLLNNAIAAYSAAMDDDARRKGAIAIARASAGLHVCTPQERAELRRDSGRKSKQVLVGQAREAVQNAIQFGRDIFAAIAGSIEIDDGVTLKEKADELTNDFKGLARDAVSLRDDALEIVGKKKPTATPKVKPRSKAKKASPRKTKAAVAPSRKKGTRSR